MVARTECRNQIKKVFHSLNWSLAFNRVQGAQAKMGNSFEGVFLQDNYYFQATFWYHWKALLSNYSHNPSLSLWLNHKAQAWFYTYLKFHLNISKITEITTVQSQTTFFPIFACAPCKVGSRGWSLTGTLQRLISVFCRYIIGFLGFPD